MPRVSGLDIRDPKELLEAARATLSQLLAHDETASLFEFLARHKDRIIPDPITHGVFLHEIYAKSLVKAVRPLTPDNAPDVNAAFIEAATFDEALDHYARNLESPDPKTLIWSIPPDFELMGEIKDLCDLHQSTLPLQKTILADAFAKSYDDDQHPAMKELLSIRNTLKSRFLNVADYWCYSVEDHPDFTFTKPPFNATYHFEVPKAVDLDSGPKIDNSNNSAFPHTDDDSSAVIINYDERYGGTYLYKDEGFGYVNGFRYLVPTSRDVIPAYEVPRPSVLFAPEGTPHSGNDMSGRMMSRAFLSAASGLPRPEDITVTPVSGHNAHNAPQINGGAA